MEYVSNYPAPPLRKRIINRDVKTAQSRINEKRIKKNYLVDVIPAFVEILTSGNYTLEFSFGKQQRKRK